MTAAANARTRTNAGAPLARLAAGIMGTALLAGLLVTLRPVILPLVAAAPDEPVVWVCGESLKVKPELAPQSRNSAWTADGKQIRLSGARQEYVGFQVVVRAGNAPLRDVEVRLGPLKTADGQTLAPGNVDLYRQHYLKVTIPSQHDNDVPVPESGPGEYPVQMVPLRDGTPGKTFTVPAGRNQPVWVDLYVPEKQSPGEYRGTVEVLSGGKPLETLNLSLTVWSFTLPRETHLKTFLPTGPEQLRWAFGLRPDQDDRLRALEDRFFQMAHQHRLNFQPSAGEPVEEEWGERYLGYLDGSAFKERAGAGVGQNLLVIGVGGESEPEVTRYVKGALAWWKRQPFSKSASIACYVYDEPQDDEDFAAVAANAGWVRAAVGRELPTFLTTTKPQRVQPGLIDIWGELPAAVVPAHQARGEKVWATNHGYAGAPFVDTPGYSGRSQGWMAWKMGLDGWYFWDGCYWMDRQNIRDSAGNRIPYKTFNADPAPFLTDTWTNPLTFDQKRNPKLKDWIRINGDGVLFYPGKPAGLEEPLASFTMKSLRRGLQDYEYLWLLKQKGQRVDDVVDRVTPRPEQWARDPDAWDAARLELGRRLEVLEGK